MDFDFLIIGSGIAGLRAAIALGDARILMLTKSDPHEGSTEYAQGGIAAALGPDDSLDLHARDTREAGAGLCDPAVVDVLVSEGRDRVLELIDWGTAFDRTPDGALDLTREGAHSVRRVLHAGDATGREIGRALWKRAAKANLTVLDHTTAVQLTTDGGRVTGARFLNRDGTMSHVAARATLIATGGAGQVFQETTNPSVAAGDGVTLAYLAGARLGDLEFVQFHPTVLAASGAPRHLLTEALRGEGGQLINAAGHPFMRDADPLGDLAPRDRVARAIVREMRRSGAPVYLSMKAVAPDKVRSRFPHLTAICRRAGLDLAVDAIPVSPAAHYMMGGVATDADGRTSLPGLFAAGEVACTGVHGANRLASNSLLEGLVFGHRAGVAMRQTHGTTAVAPPPSVRTLDAPSLREPWLEREVRDLLWTHAGVFRDGAGLRQALERLTREYGWTKLVAGLDDTVASTPDAWRSLSLMTVGALILRAALRREESRGAHWRDDFPQTDEVHWRKHVYEVRKVI